MKERTITTRRRKKCKTRLSGVAGDCGGRDGQASRPSFPQKELKGQEVEAEDRQEETEVEEKRCLQTKNNFLKNSEARA